MRIKRISIFKEFQCTGTACPVNCCMGWKVPLDDEICEKYLRDKKKLGPLFSFSVRMEDGVPAFRRVCGKCPFLGRDHLCKVQKKYGVEYMAQICRQFPRRLDNLGFFCEETLYLACPEAARLFLSRAKKGEHFVFEETEGDAAYESGTTNDDEAFLSYLLAAREQLIEMLGDACRYDSMAIVRYGKDAQNACLNGEECPNPLAYKGGGDSRLKMDCEELNKLFFNGFYHPYLMSYSPFLHRLCWKYITGFGFLSRVNPEAANRKLAALKEDLYHKIPNLDLILNRYYEYYLWTDFLTIFEDYSFSKCLVYGMAKTNVLWVFIALYARDKKSVTDDEIVKIITVLERRAPQMKSALRFL